LFNDRPRGCEHIHRCTILKETKEAFCRLALDQDIPESALLKQLVGLALSSGRLSNVQASGPSRPMPRDSRLSVQLRADDWAILKDRSHALKVPPATYAAILMRAHLRRLTPLPKEEATLLRRAIAEVGAIGRNLNQIARAMHQQVTSNGPSRAELASVIKACESCETVLRRS
jgi:hypothetical protein